MKKFLHLIVFVFIGLNIFSQTAEKIKKDKNYVWGESTAKTLEMADQFAMKDLVSQISTKVETSFSTVMTETNENIEEFTQSAIKTYSNIYLTNAKRIVKSSKKKVYVFRYMEKADIEEMFNNRKIKILDYTTLAVRAEKDLRIGDAIRYYYWALALLNSHPESGKIRYHTTENEEISLLPFIQSEIDKIFTNLRFDIKQTIDKNNTKTYILNVTYRNHPVTNLDYVYWTGNTWSNTYSLKDGLGVAEFFEGQAKDLSQLRIKTEYTYYAQSISDPEIRSVLEMAYLPRIKNAEITINLKHENEAMPMLTSQPVLNSISIYKKDTATEEKYSKSEIIKSVTLLNQAIISKNISNIENLFTEQGLESYNKIINYGNAKLLPSNDSIEYVKINNEMMVRSTPMLFNFPNSNRSFVEDVVYVFDQFGKICNVNFALSQKAINDILSRSDRFGTKEDKYFLIHFLENYKTAYSLEDLDYIEKVFSEDALIIVGTVLEKAEPIDGMYMMLDNENVKYTKYSKEEYIEHLSDAFESKEYINIQFEENEIKKTGGDEKIYGIQIAQNYYSDNYSDKGYLFLMIDLNDTINPKIYVRTWQPKKNTDGSVIGLEHFSIK
jgi:hypothetical protein